MKAVALAALETPPAVREDLPKPTPEPDQVLVRVRASSVNPADNSIAGGMLKQMGIEYEFPVILGRDYAGVVEQVGADVTRYNVGDEVFGFLLHANPTVREGSWAEFIVVPQDTSIAPAPTGVDAAIAGAAPVAGIAALTAIDALAPSEGETLLIVGATGGVGSFAVQLAARAGATVVAPALPADEAYLRELGVSELLPRDGDLAATAGERHPDGFDAVLDLVNYAPDVPATLAKDGGRVASPTGAAGEGPGRTMVIAAPTPENLQRLGGMLADGTLRLPVQATYDLAEAPDALTALATSHTQGKLAIRMQ
ncbi:MAG: Alcohol dehydrogenase GroES domain protein [Thermomicrobiales bacterium]|nr:Alcohol dehydrogenase GroES domain protein [Thermomicrobiales bacterium]